MSSLKFTDGETQDKRGHLVLLIRGRSVKGQGHLHGAQGRALVPQPWCLVKTTPGFGQRIQIPSTHSQLLVGNCTGLNWNHRAASEITAWHLVHAVQNNFKQWRSYKPRKSESDLMNVFYIFFLKKKAERATRIMYSILFPTVKHRHWNVYLGPFRNTK